jgi:hypothetical protein
MMKKKIIDGTRGLIEKMERKDREDGEGRYR